MAGATGNRAMAVHKHVIRVVKTYSVREAGKLTPPGRLEAASPSAIAFENSLASARSSCLSACNPTEVMQPGGHGSVSRRRAWQRHLFDCAEEQEARGSTRCPKLLTL